jgi:hypothetical protein
VAAKPGARQLCAGEKRETDICRCRQVVEVANDAEEEEEGFKEITDRKFEMENRAQPTNLQF